MSQNIISAHITLSQVTDALNTIESLKTQLPFLIDLSAQERRSLVKMGDQSQVFVNRALEVARTHSDILPRCFDMDEFAADVVLAERLQRLKNALSPLLDMLDDSLLAAGSDAYSDGLEELRRSMSRRFKNRRTTTENTEDSLSA